MIFSSLLCDNDIIITKPQSFVKRFKKKAYRDEEDEEDEEDKALKNQNQVFILCIFFILFIPVSFFLYWFTY
jgi:hypothetical protein